MKRSRSHWWPWVLPTLLVGLACSWLWWPVGEPDAAATEVLESAAEQWWQPDSQERTIPEVDWPPELRQLDATNVQVTAQGVFIRLGSSYAGERGLFVLPRGSTFQPQEGADPSFQLMRGRVYRYVIKG